MTGSRTLAVGFGSLLRLFCLGMGLTAYYELMILPQVAQAFTRPRFPAGYFRVELFMG